MQSLGISNIPIIEVINKSDLQKSPILNTTSYPRTHISCITGEGIDDLLELMEQASKAHYVTMKLVVDYKNGKLISFIHENAKILSQKETAESYEMEIEIASELVSKLDI